MRPVLGQWGAPPDLPAWIALGAGVALWALSSRGRPVAWGARGRWAVALAGAVLSWGYFQWYLRGTPRVIDATTYWLQARAMASGDFTWEVPDVTASFRGRFLYFNEVTRRLGGIFPPGYPLVLALGFVVGAPWLVGPSLSLAITWATGALVREMFHEHPERERMAFWAMVVSLSCVALRYHTADTLSHGAAALALTTALLWALRASRTGAGWIWSGLAAGWLVSIRPVSAVALSVVVAWLWWRGEGATRARRAALVLLGMTPGVLFFVVEQRAVTGRWLASTQTAYYARSDGPRGCFRYGFGPGIGCRFEHGEFLDWYGFGQGYGLRSAAWVTLRRLRAHLLDIANFEVLVLLVVLGAWRARKERSVRCVGAVVAGHVLAYAPFYFDGNVARGGARMFADVLPLEHALLVAGLWSLGDDGSRRAMRVVGAMAVGFAVHAVFEHHVEGEARWAALPTGEPRRGLVFVDGDHGFNLSHVPGARVRDGVVVARRRGDAHDIALFNRLGRPPAYRLVMKEAREALVPWAPGESDVLVYEADVEWPPRGQSGGHAVPRATRAPCVSGGRALALIPEGERAWAEIELPLPRAGVFEVTPVVVAEGEGSVSTPFKVPPSPDCSANPDRPSSTCGGRARGETAAIRGWRHTATLEGVGSVSLVDEDTRSVLAAWRWGGERGCIGLGHREVNAPSSRTIVRIQTTRAALALDRVEVRVR